MESPPLVRRRGQAAGVEIFFVFAQAADVADLFEHARDFFFHDATLVSVLPFVEWEICQSTTVATNKFSS